MADPIRIIIPRDGIASGTQAPRAIYSGPATEILSAIGTITTNRASHVEPGKALSQEALALLPYYITTIEHAVPGDVWFYFRIQPKFAEHWFADMTPCGQQHVLGPYAPDQRDAALRDEVAWLNANNIPCVVTEPSLDELRRITMLQDIRNLTRIHNIEFCGNTDPVADGDWYRCRINTVVSEKEEISNGTYEVRFTPESKKICERIVNYR